MTNWLDFAIFWSLICALLIVAEWRFEVSSRRKHQAWVRWMQMEIEDDRIAAEEERAPAPAPTTEPEK